MKRQDWVPAPHLRGTVDKFDYTLEPHNPSMKKTVPFALVCKYCGLIYLKNDFTRWAIKMGCNARHHPDIKSMRAKFGRKP